MGNKTPINTSRLAEQSPGMRSWVMGGAPEKIEAQERAGQGSFVQSDTLPIDGLDAVRAEIEAAGGAIGDIVPDDPLFTFVTLPPGWKKEPTNHSMWSKLVDEAGVGRARIFYKAAFYDRRAFVSHA